MAKESENRWLEIAAADASEAQRALELLSLTLDVARDLAVTFVKEHPSSCACPFCRYDSGSDETKQEVRTIASVLRWADTMLSMDGNVMPHVALPDSFPESYRVLAELAERAWDDEATPLDSDPRPRAAVAEDGSPVVNDAALDQLDARLNRHPLRDTDGPECDPLRAAVGKLFAAVWPFPSERASLVVQIGKPPGNEAAVLRADPVAGTAGVAELAEDVRRLVLALYPDATSASLLFGEDFHGGFPIRLETPADTPAVVG